MNTDKTSFFGTILIVVYVLGKPERAGLLSAYAGGTVLFSARRLRCTIRTFPVSVIFRDRGFRSSVMEPTSRRGPQ